MDVNKDTPTQVSLSKYERVQVLAMRVKQLSQGAQTSVAWTSGESLYTIALRELTEGKMPIQIQSNRPATTTK